MKRTFGFLLLIALVVVLVPGTAMAQGESPGGSSNLRLFGGFSFFHFSADGGGDIPEISRNLYGIQGNVTYYFTPRVGFTVDGSFNTGSILPDGAPAEITAANLNQTALLFGPRFVLTNSSRFTAEAFGTVGWAIGSIDLRGVNENDLPVFERLDDTVFAASFGASFDANLSNGNWAIRLAQIEVFIAKYDETSTSIRYSGGIVGTF